MSTATWIVLVIVVVVAVVALAAVVVAAMNKKKDRDRARAGQLREQAAVHATAAERLEAEAHDRASTAAAYREQREESLRQADKVDPDGGRADGEHADADGESTRGVTDQGTGRGSHRA